MVRIVPLPANNARLTTRTIGMFNMADPTQYCHHFVRPATKRPGVIAVRAPGVVPRPPARARARAGIGMRPSAVGVLGGVAADVHVAVAFGEVAGLGEWVGFQRPILGS